MAPPVQAAFKSKAAIGPRPRLLAIAGALGHIRYSGVNVQQITQSGRQDGAAARATLAAATARL
jgi:hypothetical protein